MMALPLSRTATARHLSTHESNNYTTMNIEDAIKAKFATVITAAQVTDTLHLAVCDGTGAPIGNISLEEIGKMS